MWWRQGSDSDGVTWVREKKYSLEANSSTHSWPYANNWWNIFYMPVVLPCFFFFHIAFRMVLDQKIVYPYCLTSRFIQHAPQSTVLDTNENCGLFGLKPPLQYLLLYLQLTNCNTSFQILCDSHENNIIDVFIRIKIHIPEM